MEIKNVSFSYPNSNLILKDINLKISDKTIVSIIGKNGSGKTTLLDVMTNLIKPTNGLVKNDKVVGYLFQDSKKMFFCKTVEEEIKLSAYTHNYKIKQLDKRVKDVLKIVGLKEEILDKNPLTLTNSESKKVALSTILIYNPKILILDEPTNGLEAKSIKELIKLLKMLKHRYNKTIILVSHDMEFVHSISDQVVVLYDGSIVLNGDKYSVFKDSRLLKKYGLLPPKTMLFSNMVLNKKGIKIGYRDEINDLIKDIYRNV